MRTLRFLAIQLGLSALLLEVVLQVGAIVVWCAHRPHADRSSQGSPLARTVLCVGDSFTWGIGATGPEHAYPAQLERILRAELGPEWRVCSRAWPGRNSRQVLESIDAQLAECRPGFVFVLAGGNDLWSRPELLVLDPARAPGPPSGDAFRWEWRTARLLAWLRGSAAVPSSADLALELPRQAWAIGGAPVVFLADGTVSFAGSSTPLRWRVDGAELQLRVPAGPTLRFACSPTASGFELRHPSLPESLHLTRLSAVPSDVVGATPAAVAELLASAASAPGAVTAADALDGDAPVQRAWSVRALMQNARPEAARAEVEMLRRDFARRPDRATAEALLASLQAVHADDECLERARACAELYPESAAIWSVLAHQQFRRGQAARAAESVERALLQARDDPGLRRILLRDRDRYLAAADPALALRRILETFVADGDESRLLLALNESGDAFTAELMERCLEEMAVGAPQRAALRALQARALRPLDDVTEVTRRHLQQVVERCRRAGAVPVLVTYPERCGAQHVALERLQRDAGVGVVDLAPAFAAELAKRPREELFLRDDTHCNDLGYAMVARLIADDVKRRR